MPVTTTSFFFIFILFYREVIKEREEAKTKKLQYASNFVNGMRLKCVWFKAYQINGSCLQRIENNTNNCVCVWKEKKKQWQSVYVNYTVLQHHIKISTIHTFTYVYETTTKSNQFPSNLVYNFDSLNQRFMQQNFIMLWPIFLPPLLIPMNWFQLIIYYEIS